MTKEQDLAKLEKIVESLLFRFNVLKQENGELKAQVLEKEDKIGELLAQVDSLTENKTEIHGRVSSLIDSIEDWEKSLLTEEQDETDKEMSTESKSSETDERGESQLFSIGE